MDSYFGEGNYYIYLKKDDIASLGEKALRQSLLEAGTANGTRVQLGRSCVVCVVSLEGDIRVTEHPAVSSALTPYTTISIDESVYTNIRKRRPFSLPYEKGTIYFQFPS